MHQNNIFIYFLKFIFDISPSKRSKNTKKKVKKKSKFFKNRVGAQKQTPPKNRADFNSPS